MKNIMVLGFDPVFLDIIVTPLDNNNMKIQDLPEGSEHLTNTKIKLSPGGNGLNVARVLSELQTNVYFIGNFDTNFEELVKKNSPKLNLISLTQKEPNYTVALQFIKHEKQLNSFSSDFNANDLTFESLLLLTISNIIPFSNIGLNSSGESLFEFISDYFNNLKSQTEFLNKITSPKLILETLKEIITSIGDKKLALDPLRDNFKFTEIINNFILHSVKEIDKKIFYFDPSTLSNFTSFDWLNSFLEFKFSTLPGYKFITVNEHEYNSFLNNKLDFNLILKNKNNFVIKHDEKEVIVYNSSLEDYFKISVPKIDIEKIKTSVGAGDAFNAGFLYNFGLNYDIKSGIKFAIQIAQKYIQGEL